MQRMVGVLGGVAQAAVNNEGNEVEREKHKISGGEEEQQR